MSALYVSDSAMFADAADVVRLFTGEKHLERLNEPTADGGFVLHLEELCGAWRARLYNRGALIEETEDDRRFLQLDRTPEREKTRQRKHQAKRALYRALCSYYGKSHPWGALTGIRPVKLFRELARLHGADQARREFMDAYLTASDRADLAASIMRAQEPVLPAGEDACVYVGIPFCPTRCKYCSFIAQDVKSAMNVRDKYLDALLEELSAMRTLPIPVSSVYVGGGTPTTLTAQELGRLLDALIGAFPGAAEFTVEAGRPDTVTEEKLRVLKERGVSRISVNPQTLSDATLELIGRRHTADDFHAAMRLARSVGDWDINTDIIIGLPGEEEADVMRTLDGILSYAPENLTVHSLAIKNAASDSANWERIPPEKAQSLMDSVRERLGRAGYEPYYLYRQKYMSGNLENIGFTLPGRACRYNVQHMEETSSVLALGAGAISKRVCEGGRRIERSPNVKDAAQYVERVQEMIERKLKLFGQA